MLSESAAENVGNTYTERKNPGKLLTLVRAILLILRHFAEWACQELNLGPHAYQASRSKDWHLQLRTLVGVRTRRLPIYRTKRPQHRSRIRRQGVDKSPSADDPPRSFWAFRRLSDSERRLRQEVKVARSIPTRDLTERELYAVVLDMRVGGAL